MLNNLKSYKKHIVIISVILLFVFIVGLVFYPKYISNQSDVDNVVGKKAYIICIDIIEEMKAEGIDFEIIDNTVNTARSENISDKYRLEIQNRLGDLYNPDSFIKIDFDEHNNIVLFTYETSNIIYTVDSSQKEKVTQK